LILEQEFPELSQVLLYIHKKKALHLVIVGLTKLKEKIVLVALDIIMKEPFDS
jgi:hypothetical protein